MQAAGALAQTIDHLYDTVLEDGIEQSWLDGVRGVVGASHACLSQIDDTVDWWSCSRFSEADRRVGDRFVQDDTFAFALRQVPTTTPFRLSHIVPLQEMRRTEMYQELIRPMDGGIAAIYAWHQGRGLRAVTVCRSAERDTEFSDGELAALAPMLGHLRNALRIRASLMAGNAALRGAHAALDAISDGIVIVGRQDGVRYMNLAARALLDARDGLRFEHGQLHATRLDDDRRLQSLLHGAFVVSLTDPQAAAAEMQVAITRALSRSPLFVSVAPASGLSGVFRAETFHDVAVLLVRDPERLFAQRLVAMANMFGLTPREAELAGALCAGDSIASAACRMGVTEGTARQYLKGVFAKTGTHRQAEVVSLLAGMAC